MAKKKQMPLEDAIEKVRSIRTMYAMLDKKDSRIPALDVAIAAMEERREDK